MDMFISIAPVISFGALGAILASFIGVLSERLYTGEAWMRSRSRCNSCSVLLSGRDLVPVLSVLIARGRCRICKSPIPLRYSLTEALMAGLFVLSYLKLGLTLSLVLFLLSLCALLFIVLYDIRHTIVPFKASLLFIALSFLFLLSLNESILQLGIHLMVAGAIALFFFTLFVFSRGRAMGLGDSPIALALSFLVAGQAIPGLLFSFWIGALYGIGVLVRTPKGHRMGIEVPFVPFLAAGYLLAYFSGWNPFFLF